MRSKSLFLSLIVAMLTAGPAYAHTGAHTAFSLSAGFLHPLGGLDHLLAMFAVGLLALQLGGRAIWLVPAAFVAMMIVGALAGFAGLPLPGIEHGIAISVVAIALPVAFALGMPAALAMAYVGLFAVFHGYAHGAELPAGTAAISYILGFASATAIIHGTGIAAGLACLRLAALRSSHGLRVAGGAIALAGMVLVIA